MELEACLPPDLHGATITRIAAGLSGAGVYRVETGTRAFVLKISAEPPAEWQRRVALLKLASGAGVAPRVVYVDEARRAVVSEFVVDRGFMPLYFDPRTREVAIGKLGRAIRRVHDLPLPPAGDAKDSVAFLATVWSSLAGFPVPAFVGDVVQRVLAESIPACDRAPVPSHNDLNPTNLVYDGENLVFFDWDTAGPNDPFYDLATIAVFLRMDDATSAALIAAHDDAPVAPLPARFAYDRRLVAAICGTMFLRLARTQGHAGGATTLDETLGLGAAFQRMRAGTLTAASAEGQWVLGLALAKASASL